MRERLRSSPPLAPCPEPLALVLLHFQRSSFRPSDHHRTRAFLPVRQQFRTHFIGIGAGAGGLFPVILSVPGKVDGKRGPLSSAVGGCRHLDRLAVSEKPEGRFRGGADKGGNLKNRGPIQFFRELHGHRKLEWAVAWCVRRRRNVQVDDLQFRFRAENPRGLRFRQAIDREECCEA